jgi:putative DNA primase/helicase
VFENFFNKYNIPIPSKPLSDDKFTRWGKNNRYSAIMLGIDGLYFEDFKTGIKEHWFPNAELMSKEEITLRKHLAQKARQKAAIERLEGQERTALTVNAIWDKLSKSGHSEYLERKLVEAFNIMYGKGCIAIPLYNADGKLWNIQFIYDDGSKRFFKGAKKKGCFHVIGSLKEAEPLYVVEGYSTGASVHMATYKPVIVAFDAGNLEPVITSIKSKHPNTTLTIAADNDKWSDVNTGKINAEEAARKHRCKVVVPEFLDAMQKHKPTDWNDLHLLAGKDEVHRQLMGVGYE